MFVEIKNPGSFKYALENGINLFVGAGFSILAEDSKGRRLPTGGQLAAELKERFQVNPNLNLPLPQLCTIIESSNALALDQYLRLRFEVQVLHPNYFELRKLSVKSIFTTNVDNLIPKIFSDSPGRYLNDITRNGPAPDANAIEYVPLNGAVLNLDSKLVFGADDLATVFALDPNKFHQLTNRVQVNPTLFWGFSLQDSAVLQALHPALATKYRQESWAVVPPNDTSGTAEYFTALGYQLIRAETSDLLDYFSKSSVQSAAAPDETTCDRIYRLFPGAVVPSADTVARRPLKDFFLGHTPEWSDIFSGRIHRTEHFYTLQDQLRTHRRAVVLGIPASGKTTLSMQCIAAMPFSGCKLIFSELTPEKADLLVRELNGSEAMVFVDNFSDSLDAVDRLLKQPRLTLGLFDRDYNYEFVSHRLPKLRILDVTDLSPQDLQACVQTIPEAYRDSEIRVSGDVEDRHEATSLFELIEHYTTEPSLKRRYYSVLRQLFDRDPLMEELFVMICYVRRARVPASMDMLMSYIGGQVHVKEIYEILRDMGALIGEYFGDMAMDTDQDYFAPRSVIVAEAGVDCCAPDLLGRMLLKFHKRVGPYSIPRYDIFRRYAFDNVLASRAFPDPEEGLQFYEALYRRDKSPYLLQHEALYLSGKGNHDQAFEAIDRALAMPQGQRFSIKNSHAIILFRANIERVHQSVGRQSVLRSMQILKDCYDSDRRKAFHATTFARQAIQLADKIGNEAASTYLSTATGWLEDERARSPWNRQVKYLLPEVRERRRLIGRG